MTYRRMLLMALLAVMVALAIVLGTLLALSRWAAMPSITYFVYYEGIVANQEIYFTNDAQTGRVDTPGTLTGKQSGSVAR